MVFKVDTPLSGTREQTFDGVPYAILEESLAQQLGGTRRAFDVAPNSLQRAEYREEFEIRLDTFHLGGGYSYAGGGGVYDQANKFDGSVPGRLATWEEHQTGATFTSGDFRGWLVFHNGYLYAFRGVNAVKYEITGEAGATISKIETTDLSALANADASSVVGSFSRPREFKGKLYIPLVNSSSGAGQRFCELTSGLGAGTDAFVVATTHIDIQALTLWTHPIDGPVIVASNGNLVRLASADPTVTANWTTTGYEVGDSGFDINSIAGYDKLILVGKADGKLYTFDSQGRSQQIPDVGEGPGSAEDWVGMDTVQGYLLAPHTEGLWRWRPGAGRLVGAAQDGNLDADVTDTWGRYMGLARYGRQTFFTQMNNYAGKGIVGSFLPADQQSAFRGPLVPHSHRIFNFPVEDCVVAGERPAVELDPAAAALADLQASDATVGTVAWTGGASLTEDTLVPTNIMTTPVDFDPTFEAVPNTIESRWERDIDSGSGGDYGITLEQSTTQVRNGTYSLKVTTPGNVVGEGVRMEHSLRPTVKISTDYVAVVPVWLTTGDNLEVRIREGSDTILAETDLVGNSDWQVAIIRFTPTADRVKIEVKTDPDVAAHAATFYIDDVELTEGDYAYVVDAQSRYAALTDFDQAIPDSATILGVKVDALIRAIDSDGTAHGVVDGSIKLIKGGTIQGTEKADATAWPSDVWTVKTWGGVSDMHGIALTPSDVNATNFGVAFSADASLGGIAMCAYVKITVYYSIGSGSGDPGGYLAVLATDSARTTVTPYVFKLGRAALSPSQDPNVGDSRAVDDAQFYCSRVYGAGREVVKHWRECEFYLEADPQSNTPGVEIWASIDGGAEFQLEADAEATSPTGANFVATGHHTAYFPLASSSGRYVQIIVKIPAVAGNEAKLRAVVRDLVLRGSHRTKTAEAYQVVLDLDRSASAPGRDNLREDLRTIAGQRAALDALRDPAKGAISYHAPGDRSGRCEILDIVYREAQFRDATEPRTLALVTYRRAPYG
jgi:hypothetical protein